jgi:hypothetical protein
MVVLQRCDFDRARDQVWEVGAGLLALLAYPGEAEIDQRVAAAQALCAIKVQVTMNTFPEEERALRYCFPLYATMELAEIRRRLRTFRNRCRARMLASWMALYFFERAFTDTPQALPPGIKKPSINAFSLLVLPQTHISEPEMVERRIWRTSFPVIHLATALQVLGRAIGRDLDAFGYPLEDGGLHQRVIGFANMHAAVVRGDPSFGKYPDRLVELSYV